MTPVEAMAAAKLISQPIVSYNIPRFADHKNDGEMTFGGMDPTKYDASTLVTVKNKSGLGFWEAPLDAVHVNGADLGWRNRTLILDTGTVSFTQIYICRCVDLILFRLSLSLHPRQVPKVSMSDLLTDVTWELEDVATLHAAIPGAKKDGDTWTVPCTLKTPISFTVGGREFSIDPRDIAFAPVDQNNPNGACMSGISEGNPGLVNTEWLVSDISAPSFSSQRCARPGWRRLPQERLSQHERGNEHNFLRQKE